MRSRSPGWWSGAQCSVPPAVGSAASEAASSSSRASCDPRRPAHPPGRGSELRPGDRARRRSGRRCSQPASRARRRDGGRSSRSRDERAGQRAVERPRSGRPCARASRTAPHARRAASRESDGAAAIAPRRAPATSPGATRTAAVRGRGARAARRARRRRPGCRTPAPRPRRGRRARPSTGSRVPRRRRRGARRAPRARGGRRTRCPVAEPRPDLGLEVRRGPRSVRRAAAGDRPAPPRRSRGASPSPARSGPNHTSGPPPPPGPPARDVDAVVDHVRVRHEVRTTARAVCSLTATNVTGQSLAGLDRRLEPRRRRRVQRASRSACRRVAAMATGR